VKLHSVEFRVKSEESIQRKLLLKPDRYGRLEELHDLLGIRVTTYFLNDVKKAAEAVESEFMVDKANSVNKLAAAAPDRFGYAAIHYVAELGESRTGLPEYSAFAGQVFELQVRSILQHAWAEMQHDLGYKQEPAIPSAMIRRYSRLAGLLEIADDEFQRLQNELTAYSAEVHSKSAEELDPLELNQSTLSAFVQKDTTVAALDNYVATQFGPSVVVGDQARALLDGDVRRLNLVGVYTVQELKDALSEQKDRVRKFARAWLEDPSTELDFGRVVEIVPMGISLFYLFYVLLNARIPSDKQAQALVNIAPVGPEFTSRIHTVWDTINQE
jgi:putative GTP pyrophosphokinase